MKFLVPPLLACLVAAPSFFAVEAAVPKLLRGGSSSSLDSDAAEAGETKSRRELYAACQWMEQLSVTNDGDVWGVTERGRICYRKFSDGSLTRIDGALKQVSVSGNGKHVWGVNSNNKIYYYDSAENKFKHFQNGLLKQVSVDDQGVVVGVNANNKIYVKQLNETSWTQVGYDINTLEQVSISANGLHMFGVTHKYDICYWASFMIWCFDPKYGKLKHVSVNNQGDIWGVNANNKIYFKTRHDSKFTQIGDDRNMLKQISVSGDGTEVWGVNENNAIYRWDGKKFVNLY